MSWTRLLFHPWLWVWGCCALVAITFGFSWSNVANQAQYMLAPMKAIDPSFIPSDWLTHETYHYHENFVHLAVLLNALGPLPWMSALLNLGLILLGFFLLFSLLRSLETPHLAAASLLLVALVCADRTRTVADSYIFASGLQPSVVAASFWLVAIVAFVSNRFLGSGLALAAGGYFHINFLVLGFPAFGLAHLMLGRPDFIRRCLMQLVPSAVVLIPELPTLLAAGVGPDAGVAREIMQSIRAPAHYIPLSYIEDFVPYAFWIAAGLFATAWISHRDAQRRVRALIVGFTAPVAVATALTTIVFVPQVSQLFFWRMAPFGMIISQIAVIHAMMTTVPDHSASEERGNLKLLVVVLVASLVVWLSWYGLGYDERSRQAILVMALAAGLILLLPRLPESWGGAIAGRAKARLWAAVVLSSLSVLPALGHQFYMTVSTSTILPTSSRDDKQRLYAWVRTTPPSARFLTSPDLGGFRLRGQRAIVADWQSTPMLASELIAWYRLMEDISGRRNVGSLDEAVRGYACMTPERLERLAEQHRLDYAVFRTPLPSTLESYPVAYSNESFVVLDLRHDPAAARRDERVNVQPEGQNAEGQNAATGCDRSG